MVFLKYEPQQNKKSGLDPSAGSSCGIFFPSEPLSGGGTRGQSVSELQKQHHMVKGNDGKNVLRKQKSELGKTYPGPTRIVPVQRDTQRRQSTCFASILSKYVPPEHFGLE